MALNWKWEDKMGEAILEEQSERYSMEIFKGNAYAIWVWRDKEEKTYTLANFWVDKEHLKNMLGLNSKNGYGDINLINEHIRTQEIKCIRLNTKYKHVPEIVSLMAKAKTNVTIELYYE